MEELQISTESKTYPLFIGHGIRHNIAVLLKKLQKQFTSIFIITDSNVAPLYLKDIEDALDNNEKVYSYVVQGGEEAKSFENFYACHSFALEHKLDRHSVIIALGGGVVGDLAGFVASTYMRGIAFVQVPTTLLAHDSSVGGKVAINHPLGKNMIGAFYQPEAVVYDIDVLNSLSEGEWRSGFAEVIKHALIWDVNFYNWLHANITSLHNLRDENLIYALKKGISVKAAVVSNDEKENGLRAILNFGHTLAHAIEAELGYGVVSHGDAVAMGMLFAMKVSEKHYETDLQLSEFREWFLSLGFPPLKKDLDPGKLWSYMKKDKKVQGGQLRMVLMKKVGEVETVSLSDDFVYSLLLEEIEGGSEK